MKKIITLIVILLASLCQKSFSQVTYPCGVYFLGLNGTTDYGAWSNVYPTNDYTLAAWVQITDAVWQGKEMDIFQRQVGGFGDMDGLDLYIAVDGTFKFRAYTFKAGVPTLDSVSSGVKPDPNKWYHVAVTFQSTGNCNIYINGNLANSKSFGGAMSLNYPYLNYLAIGCKNSYPQGSIIVTFKGYLDELAVAEKALTQDQIRTLANGLSAGDPFFVANSVDSYDKEDTYPSRTNLGIGGGSVAINGQLYYCQYNPPIANAGPDQTIILPANSVTLSGNATPGTGTIVGGVWSKVSGPSGGDISDVNSQTPVITNLQEGTYVFKLTITDDKGYTGTDEVSIFVKAEKRFDTSKCPGILIDISGIINRTDFLNVSWEKLDRASFDPTKVDTGHYNLVTTKDNLVFDTTKITVTNYSKPDLGLDQVQEFCPITYANESHLFDDVLQENPDYSMVGWFTLSGIPVDPTLVPFEPVEFIVVNEFGCFDTARVGAKAYPVKNILPASPQVLMANRETIPDVEGWIDYYYDFIDNMGNNKNFLLLSLNTGGNNDIGHIGDGKFQVKVVATPGAGSGNAIKLTNPLITNPSGTYVMNRYWTVTSNPEPKFSVGVRFYYNNADFDDVKSSLPYLTDANSPTDNERMYFFKSDGGNPDPTSNLDGATSITTISSGDIAGPDTWVFTALGCGENQAEFEVESFSGGGGGGTVNELPLPILLKNFSAILSSNNVSLTWQTAQEINTSYFDIERRVDGNNFSSIGQVNASGNSSTIKNYSYIDNKPTNGINYYRLKMVDADGKFTYSKIVTVKNDANDNSFRIFPNPANEILYVQATSENDFATLQIFDASGRKLREEKVVLNGNNSTSINIKDLPKGIYSLLLKGKTINEHQKFVKQ